MTDIFSTPDDTDELHASDLHTSLGEQLGAEAKNALDPSTWLSGVGIGRALRAGIAGGNLPHDWDGLPGAAGLQLKDIEDQARAQIPSVSIDDARQRVNEAGLEGHVHLPEQGEIKSPVLDLMIQEGHERRDRQAAVARGPQGFYPDALGMVTSIGAGMIDPVSIAAFSLPVVGEARWGKIVESAGDSIAARAALNFGRGAAQGTVGTSVLQPAEWWLHSRDGQDYTFADALKQVTLGAAMAGFAHAGLGTVGDVLTRRRGMPLPGSPKDLLTRGQMTGAHVPGEALSDDGATVDHVAEIMGLPQDLASAVEPEPSEQPHPSELYADLPPAAQQDALRVAMADMIDGQLPQPMEMLQVAADSSARIAESIDAYHGSPHDFDRFDLSKIGTGEGAQAYGHGLYFAENEKVARGYQRDTSEKVFIDKVASLYDEGHGPDEAWGEIQDNWDDFTPQEQRLMTALHKDDWLGFDYPHQAVSAALSRNAPAKWEMSPETIEAIKGVGQMYKVRISADQDHFLDWDSKISEQTPHVQSALRAIAERYLESHPGDDHDVMHAINANEGADTFYERLADALKTMRKGKPDKNGFYKFDEGHGAASRALAEAGVPGVKYRDQKSRGLDTDPERLKQNLQNWRDSLAAREAELAADPNNRQAADEVELARRMVAQGERDVRDGVKETRNFVVFDDKHIEITHKNGEPVKRDEITKHLTAKTPRGRAAADPKIWSLFEALAHEGGLKPDPELTAIFGNAKGPFVPGFGALVRPSGRTLDDALRLAKDRGYLFDASDVTGDEAHLTPRDLLDRLAEENAGRRQYQHDQALSTKGEDRGAAEREKAEIIRHLHDQLESASGLPHSAIDPKLEDRVVEMMTREGERDVLNAYERAIMEDQERYNAETAGRQAGQDVLAGRDLSNDAGRASAGGGAASSTSAPARGLRSGSGGDAGAEPRLSRGGHGASDQAALARDQAFAKLGDRLPAHDAPADVENSRWADTLPEPASLDPKKSTAALQQAATEAEQIWRDLEPYLSEEERRTFNDRLEQAGRDAQANLQVLKDGAACLAAAVS
jgi:hypothetical protein